MSTERDARVKDLGEFLGWHFIYIYENGWRYEMYIKNDQTIDYRIHGGIVGGRWVRDQKVYIARLAKSVYKVSWDEPTGTAVSVAFNLTERRVHGVIFFPRWVAVAPEKTICFQNEKIEQMVAWRDAGPTYPKLVIDEFATITFAERCEIDDQTVIACGPFDLPLGYADRRN